jgi:hypothetical protein|tara:strand:+ start:5745 stop:6026 length:282 start_codon:yes stop_codon:yes gene_type:complete
MNYTLKEISNLVNNMIAMQGEDAQCGAWIYTAEDCAIYDEDGNPEYVCDGNPELTKAIFNEVGNIDHIYTVIQECVDEVTEEKWMSQQANQDT